MGDFNNYIAHENQSLKAHLKGVAKLCRKYAARIGYGNYGELLGFLHDIGKYSEKFQIYIKSAIGKLNPDEDEEFVDTKGLKGKIDHSTAGAQFVWYKISSKKETGLLLAQILVLCLVSHHSGLINCLENGSEGAVDVFSRRIRKPYDRTFYDEVLTKAEIIDPLEKIIQKPDFLGPMYKIETTIKKKYTEDNLYLFHMGLLTRILFSCLVDADRQDTADSEKPGLKKIRQNEQYASWDKLIPRLEKHLKKFEESQLTIDIIRKEISEYCLMASIKKRGLFTLTVPTGGGKTLASLRFGLYHAQKHKLIRIFYIVPFTTIIDQNAGDVRKILELESSEKGKIVLEHHSNIGAEKQGWKEKLLTENWDAPIVFTTMVQFLEALFGGGTRGVRRMHQLANSLIIFDEIQALPIKCVHLFCNAINFLVDQCRSSVVLCTATQPLLGQVDSKKGNLRLSQKNEIVPNTHEMFKNLERVQVIDKRKSGGWTDVEVADLIEESVNKRGSCLVVVNLKRSAYSLYKVIKERNIAKCYHLTTAMCPAHRKNILRNIEKSLKAKKEPIVCISTSLIECGVDISFGTAIRYLAGLDSVAQAFGRCNRHKEVDFGLVYIVNPADEDLHALEDVYIGAKCAENILDDFKKRPKAYDGDPIGPKANKAYYQNYFLDRKKKMSYPVSFKEAGRDDTILNLLSSNSLTVNDFKRNFNVSYPLPLSQAFMTAGNIFRTIDAPTESVIVPYEKEGEDIITKLCGTFEIEKHYELLREAQQYSVNLYPHDFEKLKQEKALMLVQEDTEIYYVDAKYYSEEFGISLKAIGKDGLIYVPNS